MAWGKNAWGKNARWEERENARPTRTQDQCTQGFESPKSGVLAGLPSLAFLRSSSLAFFPTAFSRSSYFAFFSTALNLIAMRDPCEPESDGEGQRADHDVRGRHLRPAHRPDDLRTEKDL